MAIEENLIDCPLRQPDCEKRDCAWPTLEKEKCEMFGILLLFAVASQKELLRISEAAQLLHIHPTTLRRWSNKGLLKVSRLGSRGDRRYRRKDINDFLDKI